MKEQRVQISSYAGLLLSGGDDARRQPGRGKSVVLLLGRLLMASLFLFVGITQVGGQAGGWLGPASTDGWLGPARTRAAVP